MAHETDSEANPAAPELGVISGTGDGRDITRPWIGPLMASQDSVLIKRGGGLELYEQVLSDDQVMSTFQQRRNAVVARDWEVVAGGDSAIDKAAADFIREQLNHIRFDAVTDKMLFGVFYGYSVGECMWARDGRQITLDKIKVRKARRFRFGSEGELRLLVRGKPKGEEMPERKFWTFSTGADNDDEPYGLGLGHWLYWPVLFKRNNIKFWLIFLEKFGMPTAVGKYPANATQDDQDKLLAATQAVQSDSGIIMPDGMLIELLEAGRSGKADYGGLYDTMNGSIAKVVLSQTMTTDDGASLSQAQVHEGVRDDVVEADADLICSSFNNGPGRWLTEWNYPGAATPIVRRIMESPEDLNTAAERDGKLFEMGYVPTEERIRETYGEGYVKHTPTPPADNRTAANIADDDAAFAEDDDEQDAIAALIEAAAGEWEEMGDPIMAPVRELIANAGTMEEIRDGLAGVIGDMEPAAFAEVLAKAGFAARIAGETGAPTSADEE